MAVRRVYALFLACATLVSLGGCDRLLDQGIKEKIAAAEKKTKAGDHRAAIRLYEAALDGTAGTADVHYQMAVLYDENLKRPGDAAHHFQRYLELAPDGRLAKEAKAYKKQCELRLLSSLSSGAPLSQAESARLRNKNLDLVKEIAELRARLAAQSAAARADSRSAPPAGARRHVVQSGETLASISQKYYRTRNRANDILEANRQQLGGKSVIKAGQTLIIP